MSRKSPCRRRRGLLEQMHRGRARPRLRHLPARRRSSRTKGKATTLVLDLHDQWANLEKTGQYRFTPPIHVIVAFHQALEAVRAGGRRRRTRRGATAENCRILVEGMRALGFRTLLPDASSGADHRHLPHAGRSALRVPALL